MINTDNSRIEDMIQIYAESKGFHLSDRSHNDLCIYCRLSPDATASIRISDAAFAMQRSPSEFDKLLSEKFDK